MMETITFSNSLISLRNEQWLFFLSSKFRRENSSVRIEYPNCSSWWILLLMYLKIRMIKSLLAITAKISNKLRNQMKIFSKITVEAVQTEVISSTNIQITAWIKIQITAWIKQISITISAIIKMGHLFRKIRTKRKQQ